MTKKTLKRIAPLLNKSAIAAALGITRQKFYGICGNNTELRLDIAVKLDKLLTAHGVTVSDTPKINLP